VAVAVDKIVDAFCPPGILDEDIARLAMGESLATALAGVDTFDPNAIDANAVRVATLTFAAELVFLSVAGDGGRALAAAPRPTAAAQREADISSARSGRYGWDTDLSGRWKYVNAGRNGSVDFTTRPSCAIRNRNVVIARVLASSNPGRASAAREEGGLGFALYHIGRPELAGIGHTLLDEVRKLHEAPTLRAWDFLSIALAVFGADRFIPRGPSPDGWTRVISLEVEVVEPEPWSAQAVPLAAALRFLTGDIWHVNFRSGGQRPPEFPRSVTDRDCACLFSGGLDSLIGAADLIADGRRPILVSQASPKEGGIQKNLAARIGLQQHRFEGRVTERARAPYEPSSRSRSMVFFAYGALAAPRVGGELFVPENGLISINPPLTRRRVGSLSTRTTHPYFISSMQTVFDSAGLGVTLVNPYQCKTKGEMLDECANPIVAEIAAASYSCGKGKRLNKHCGRCVPCLIRRAAFLKAGLADLTDYAADDLARNAANDDVYAVRLAVAALAHRDVARWAAEAGPLSVDAEWRKAEVDVVRRGLQELRDLMCGIAWP
jgi:7-cyano-7-deazaguanine synthase in queuosine biosynthesis